MNSKYKVAVHFFFERVKMTNIKQLSKNLVFRDRSKDLEIARLSNFASSGDELTFNPAINYEKLTFLQKMLHKIFGINFYDKANKKIGIVINACQFNNSTGYWVFFKNTQMFVPSKSVVRS